MKAKTGSLVLITIGVAGFLSLGLVSPAAGGLVSEPATFDFGEVWKGESVTAKFSLVNDGPDPVTVTKVKLTCGCLTYRLSDEVIPPGKSALLEVDFDTAKFSNRITTKVYVHTDRQEDTPLTLTVSGYIRWILNHDPPLARVDGIKAGETRNVTFQVVNHGSEPVTISEVDISSSLLPREGSLATIISPSGDSLPITLGPDEETEVSVAVHPPRILGLFRVSVVLITDIDNKPAYQMTIRGGMTP